MGHMIAVGLQRHSRTGKAQIIETPAGGRHGDQERGYLDAAASELFSLPE